MYENSTKRIYPRETAFSCIQAGDQVDCKYNGWITNKYVYTLGRDACRQPMIQSFNLHQKVHPSSLTTHNPFTKTQNNHYNDHQTSIHLRKLHSSPHHQFSHLTLRQALRTAARPIATKPIFPRRTLLTPIQLRLLSNETKVAIDKAVSTSPVVLFMKGTPETPQCGFSRATIQILGVEGVDPEKFTAYNVLEDPELRAGQLIP
jgi:hypothetical protein